MKDRVKFITEQSYKNNFVEGRYKSWGETGYYCFECYPIIEINWCNWDSSLISAQKGKVSHENPYDYKEKRHKPGVSLDDIGYLINTSKHIKSIKLALFRVSKYSSVKGKSFLSGEKVPVEEYHCHHLIPKYKGGTNDFINLCVLSEAEHELLHSKKAEELYTLYPKSKKKIDKLIINL